MFKTEQIKKECLDANISKIYCRLASADSFDGNIEALPHKKVLDMLLIYYVRVNITHNEFLSIMVNKRLLESIGITEEQLNKIAWVNTIRDNPAVFKPLKQVLSELGVSPGDESRGVYMISNENKYMGAVCIQYPGFLERVGNIINSDFFVLPSSVHECLVLPCDDSIKASELRRTVKCINNTELKIKDVLSNSVYRYIRASRRLIVDNS